MIEVKIVLVILFVGITAYAVLAGADFGAGFWDLVAGGPRRGRKQRVLIEQSLGPVWETNHVWLILVLVILWTCFPVAFGSIMSTLFIPLTLVAVGIILRGSGFAFRRLVPTTRAQRFYGATFAASSVVTPFFLGAVAGGVASGRVPVGNARGNPITSWLNPSGVLGGTLAVLTCAFLAAVYLAADADRRRLPGLPDAFRIRAMVLGVITGVVAVAGIFVLRADAIALSNRLFSGRALPLAALSGVGGVVAMYLLWTRRYTWARVAAALAVTCVVWGWGVGQYPYMLEGTLTVFQAAAPDATLDAMIVTLLAGTVILVPSFWLLYTLNAGDHLTEESAMEDPDDPAPQEGPVGSAGSAAPVEVGPPPA